MDFIWHYWSEKLNLVRQNNHNPFIDHPEYVSSIWSNLLSTKGNNFKNEVSIFPNPLKENLLNIRSHVDLQVEIYDVLGKRVLIHKTDRYNKSLNLSHFKSGIYLVKLLSENSSVTKKLIKQ